MADEIVRSMDAASRALRIATKEAMKEAGTVARQELTATAKLAAGSDRRFSNFKKAGALGVKLRQQPGAVDVSPSGPWGLAERGRPPSAGNRGTQATQGKGRWSQGRDATFQQLEKSVPQQIEDAVEEGFNRG